MSASQAQQPDKSADLAAAASSIGVGVGEKPSAATVGIAVGDHVIVSITKQKQKYDQKKAVVIHLWPLRAKPAAKVKMLEGDGKDDELERPLDTLARVASCSVVTAAAVPMPLVDGGGADAAAEPPPKQAKKAASEDRATALFGALSDL